MISQLTPEEVEIGIVEGKLRNENAIKGRADQHKYGFEGDNEEIHIQGCWSEIAAAKALGLKWDNGPWRRFSYDVGELQIRSTQLERGRLIIRPGDCDDDIFVFTPAIDQKTYTYELRGWIKASEGKRPIFYYDKNKRDPMFLVPEGYLSPIHNPLPDDYFDTYPGLTDEARAQMKQRYSDKIELSLPKQLRTHITIPFMNYGTDTASD